MVMAVEPAAGASVSLVTTRFATTKTTASTRTGTTSPNTTTRPLATFSRRPRYGSPSRFRRSQAIVIMKTAPRKTIEATASIHHQSVEMSWAGLLLGASVDWPPPQPAIAIEHAIGPTSRSRLATARIITRLRSRAHAGGHGRTRLRPRPDPLHPFGQPRGQCHDRERRVGGSLGGHHAPVGDEQVGDPPYPVVGVDHAVLWR